MLWFSSAGERKRVAARLWGPQEWAESFVYADDRLAVTAAGRVERGGSVAEHVRRSDDWTQSPLAKPEFQLGELPRWGSTTKKTARPPSGWIGGGSAMLTSTPPGRTNVAERSRMSPPITSKTMSTLPTPPAVGEQPLPCRET